MKVFLLSDLVVHELASMQLEGKWLSSQHFSESARLWISRYAPNVQLSRMLLEEIEREVMQIAMRLAQDDSDVACQAPLTRLFLDIPAVNYAHPLSVRALSASLEACRDKAHEAGDGASAACVRASRSPLGCHPALCMLVCGFDDAPKPPRTND